jgi:hypothetical protein
MQVNGYLFNIKINIVYLSILFNDLVYKEWMLILNKKTRKRTNKTKEELLT